MQKQLIIGSLCCSFWCITIDQVSLCVRLPDRSFRFIFTRRLNTRLTPTPRSRRQPSVPVGVATKTKYATCPYIVAFVVSVLRVRHVHVGQVVLGSQACGFWVFSGRGGRGGSDIKGLSFHFSVVDIFPLAQFVVKVTHHFRCLCVSVVCRWWCVCGVIVLPHVVCYGSPRQVDVHVRDLSPAQVCFSNSRNSLCTFVIP